MSSGPDPGVVFIDRQTQMMGIVDQEGTLQATEMSSGLSNEQAVLNLQQLYNIESNKVVVIDPNWTFEELFAAAAPED